MRQNYSTLSDSSIVRNRYICRMENSARAHQIIGNLSSIKERIAQACTKAGRDANEVKLMLVTKTVSAEDIRIALLQGENLIGENKVQELSQKSPLLSDISYQKHFIGHLQTNKIKDVLKYADCIQSVDRLELAEKLQQRLQFEDKYIDIFIQVNTSFEESKFGVHPNHAMELIKAVSKLDRLRIKGLMTIGLFDSNEEKIRPCFQRLAQIKEEANLLPNISIQELSMGMSGDLEIAIEEGATIVRIGTAIFGERIYPDSHYWDENK